MLLDTSKGLLITDRDPRRYVEDLAKAPGMNKKAAVAIVKYFETAVGTMPVGEYET